MKTRGGSGACWPALALLALLAGSVTPAASGAPVSTSASDHVAMQGRGGGFPMNDPSSRPQPPPASGPHNLWTNHSPTVNTPSAGFLRNSAAVHDGNRDRLLAIGSTGVVIEVWSFSPGNNTWTNITPAGPGPSHRTASQVALSPATDEVLFFAGATGPGLYHALNDTWLLDIGNRTWSNITGGPAPGSRAYGAIAYHPPTGRAILHAGCNSWRTGQICNGNPTDTWAFDFGTRGWSKFNTLVAPSGRSGHEMAYDPGTDRMLVFSGYEGANDFNPTDTWVLYMGNTTWKQLFPSKTPTARNFHSMTFDSRANRFVLFGGWGAAFKANNETWTFSFSNGNWAELKPALAPSAREGDHLAYDSGRDVTWMYGGGVGDTPILFDDVWSYSLGNVSSPPLNLSASGATRRVSLSWDPPANPGDSPVTGFFVYRGTSAGVLLQVASLGNVTSYNDTGLFGARYYYRVAAITALGTSPWSVQASADVISEPGPPRNLVITPGDARITLSWQTAAADGGRPVIDYIVYRGAQSGNYSTNFTSNNVTGYLDSTVANGQTYYYTVAAVNAIGEGARALESSATPQSSAVAPAVLTTSPANGSKGVPVDADITVGFNVDMNATSLVAAFSLTPPVAGATVTVTGNTVRLAHAAQFASLTSYAVRIGGSARSATSNLTLGNDTVFGFTTMEVKNAAYTVTGQVTRGDDPAAGARVDAFDWPALALAGTTFTLADGSYALQLEGNRTYVIEVTFTDGGKERTDPFTLTDHSVKNVRAPRAPVPPWSPSWLLLGVGIVGTLTVVGLAYAIGGEAVAFILLLIPIVLYSKIHRDKVLDHFVRGQIYGHIKTNPGATFTEIGNVLGVANGVLTYHLYTLEKLEFIRSEKQGRWKRFFPRDAPKTKTGVFVSRLQKEILELIKANPGMTQVDIAGKLGTKRQNVNYNVQKLIEVGLVRLEGWGFRKKCLPLGDAESVAGPKPTPEELKVIEASGSGK